MIGIEKAEKYFLTRTIKTLALNELSLSVAAGEFVAVMGPSGSGKTTLLNVIGLFETLNAGRLTLAGHDTAGLSNAKKVALRRQLIGYIFQSFNLISPLTVEQNVALPLKYRSVPAAERRQRVAAALASLGLQNRAEHYPAQLSGGQQQRVAIARAMIARPPLILADEPTGNLDSKTSRDVLTLLREIHLQGTTIVMVTHSEDAAGNASRVVMMRDGYID